MNVEIFGHAGAGKSTLAAGLVLRLLRRGVGAIAIDGRGRMNDGKLAKRTHQALGLVRAPGTAALGAKLLRDNGRPWRALGTLGGLAYRKRVIEASQGLSPILLVDEGVLHGVWSLTLLSKTPEPAALHALLDRLLDTQLAISLRPERSVVLEGLRRNGDSRLRPMDAERVTELLDKQETLLNAIDNYMDRRGKLIRVNDTKPATLDELTAMLIQHSTSDIRHSTFKTVRGSAADRKAELPQGPGPF